MSRLRWRPSSKACSRNAPSRLAKQGISTFSKTVRSPKISGVWNTRRIPIWLISCGLRPSTDWPVEGDRAGVGDQLADQHVQQGRLAGAVRADDRVDRVLGDRQVDVVQRLQAAEALVDVLDFENAHARVSLFGHMRGGFRLIAAVVRVGLRRRNSRPMRCAPSIRPPGRKITTSMNIRPSVSGQPSPVKRAAIQTTTSCDAVGQEREPAVQHVLVDLREDVLEILDEAGAQHRPDQRAGAAEDRHDARPRPRRSTASARHRPAGPCRPAARRRARHTCPRSRRPPACRAGRSGRCSSSGSGWS